MAHDSAGLKFPGQETDERIFVYTRRYFFAFLPTAFLILAMIVLGSSLFYIISSINNNFSNNNLILLSSAFTLFMLLFALIEFFDFYFDVYIVTDRRIVDIDQYRLFNRSVASLSLEDLQDVKANTKGFFPTLLDYGDVLIQTAGTANNFLFEQVKHPNEISSMIIDLSEQGRDGLAVEARMPTGEIKMILNDELMTEPPDDIV